MYSYLKTGVAGTKDGTDRWIITPKDIKLFQKHKSTVKHGRPAKPVAVE
jgi:hypothetical protein